jgi:hypothetical protein
VPQLSDPAPVPAPDSGGEAPALLRPGDTVEHTSFGEGIFQHVAEVRVTVLFRSAGYRTLDPTGALERGLSRWAS